MAGQNLTAASHQWATRPDDQRFPSMEALKQAVLSRKHESWTATPQVRDLRVLPAADNNLVLDVYDPTHGGRRMLEPTHWAFSQLAQYAQAPASYIRKLPAELAAINLQWGLERTPMRDDTLVLGRSNGCHELRAMTSTSYGRIWDYQVVQAVERVNATGRWEIPAASYATTNPKRATTLYASDRDVFIFLVDAKHPIEVPGEDSPMFRGFYTWNSEVGSQVFGLSTFLYRYVCDNRIIWGATDVRELRIRHTSGAPDRFAYEGQQYLNRYADESTARIIEQVQAAKAKELDVPKGKDGISQWLQQRGFTKTESVGADNAREQDGGGRSVWDVINGVTAYARSISHTDARVALESKAGKLMDMVA